MKKALLVLLPIVLLCGVDQAVRWTAMSDGWFLGRRVTPFVPPIFNSEQAAALDRLRRTAAGEPDAPRHVAFDADLGWTTRPGFAAPDVSYDADGARVSPAPDGARATKTLVVVGGSFTHGDEVKDAEAWPALVDAARDDWRVANLGVGAYGLDQARMRYLKDGRRLAADEVWLGLMPSATLRVVTQYRPALRHQDPSVAFKPRYRWDGPGRLEVVPNPARTIADVVDLVTNANGASFCAAMNGNDHWVSRSPGAYRPHWMQWTAIGTLVQTRLEGQGREPESMLEDEGHELFRLIVAIVLALRDDAREDGASFRLLVLPDGRSLARRAESGRAYWEGAVGALRNQGVEVTDLSDALVDAGARADRSLWMPGGHYSAKGNAVVAGAVGGLLGE